jgi:hypothetical protein
MSAEIRDGECWVVDAQFEYTAGFQATKRAWLIPLACSIIPQGSERPRNVSIRGYEDIKREGIHPVSFAMTYLLQVEIMPG